MDRQRLLHARDVDYATSPVDFAQLVEEELELRDLAGDRGRLDFGGGNGLVGRLVTKVLLRRDFDLEIELVEDRLCPTVPSRLAYVRWIECLVGFARAVLDLPVSSIAGLDIGTGAYAVYAALLARRNPGWHIHASEADDRSHAHAAQCIARNRLQTQITLHKVTADEPFLACMHDLPGQLTFTMCNPPFYSSQNEMDELESRKSRGPRGKLQAASCELVTGGGEIGFTRRLIDESVRCRDGGGGAMWYTTLLGKSSSVVALVEVLKEVGVTSYGIADFQPGVTKRWILVWSFLPCRLPDALARASTTPALAASLPARASYALDLHNLSQGEGIACLTDFAQSITVPWLVHRQRLGKRRGRGETDDDDEDEGDRIVWMGIRRDTWSRAARRRGGFEDKSTTQADPIVLGIAIRVAAAGQAQLHRFICSDEALWLSFQGKLSHYLQQSHSQDTRQTSATPIVESVDAESLDMETLKMYLRVQSLY
ncbi:hypothetical protein PYCC9005_004288 [Savitreella phatthalungensis]